MPAAMYRTVLMFLLSVNVCTGTTTSSTAKQVTQTSKATADPITLSVMTKNDVTSLATKATDKPVTPTNQSETTPAAGPGNVPTSPPPTASTETPNKTTAAQMTSSPPLKATTKNTPNQTETTGSTVTTAPTTLPVTPATTLNSTNTTDPGLTGDWDKDDLAANPGLVAILCIFFIVLVLGLVVAMVKCFDPPRSNFERLEDVPMGKVNEESPFAHYSK